MVVFYFFEKSELMAKSHCGLRNAQMAKVTTTKSQTGCFSGESGAELGPRL